MLIVQKMKDSMGGTIDMLRLGLAPAGDVPPTDISAANLNGGVMLGIRRPLSDLVVMLSAGEVEQIMAAVRAAEAYVESRDLAKSIAAGGAGFAAVRAISNCATV